MLTGSSQAQTHSGSDTEVPMPARDIRVSQQVGDVVTTIDVDNVRTAIHMLSERVKTGDHPAPAEIEAWLSTLSATAFPADPVNSSMSILPILHLLDTEYGAYETTVSSLFQTRSIAHPLRSALLEVIERHWDCGTPQQVLLTVFGSPGEEVILRGQIAFVLAKHGQLIGAKLMTEYRVAPPEARFYFAQALAVLGRPEAIELLREDAMAAQSVALRSVSIRGLISLDPSSAETSALVEEIVHAARPVPSLNRSVRDFDNERLAMHAVQALGQSDAEGISERLLLIAIDDTIAVDVRLTALDSLAIIAGEMPDSARASLYQELVGIRQQTMESTQLSETNRGRMLLRISILQNQTAPRSPERQ
jgi:hypothetical protein